MKVFFCFVFVFFWGGVLVFGWICYYFRKVTALGFDPSIVGHKGGNSKIFNREMIRH